MCRLLFRSGGFSSFGGLFVLSKYLYAYSSYGQNKTFAEEDGLLKFVDNPKLRCSSINSAVRRGEWELGIV